MEFEASGYLEEPLPAWVGVRAASGAGAGSARSVSLMAPMLAHRRQPSDLVINAPLLSSLATKTSALGLGFGDRFRSFLGRSGSFEEMVLHTDTPGELQGKRATTHLLGIT